jgi:hypothetical protein
MPRSTPDSAEPPVVDNAAMASMSPEQLVTGWWRTQYVFGDGVLHAHKHDHGRIDLGAAPPSGVPLDNVLDCNGVRDRGIEGTDNASDGTQAQQCQLTVPPVRAGYLPSGWSDQLLPERGGGSGAPGFHWEARNGRGFIAISLTPVAARSAGYSLADARPITVLGRAGMIGRIENGVGVRVDIEEPSFGSCTGLLLDGYSVSEDELRRVAEGLALTASTASATAPRCHTGDLSTRVVGVGAALGHVGVVIAFRNSSGHACRVYGYPGLQMLDSNQRAMATHVHRGGSYTHPDVAPRRVVLGPREDASFSLGYGHVPEGDAAPQETQCPGSTYAAVTPPDETASVVIDLAMDPCRGDVYVSPVVAGSDGVQF